MEQLHLKVGIAGKSVWHAKELQFVEYVGLRWVS